MEETRRVVRNVFTSNAVWPAHHILRGLHLLCVLGELCSESSPIVRSSEPYFVAVAPAGSGACPRISPQSRVNR